MARALIIQLARLGDLLQSIPAIAAIKAGNPDLTLDLLCPSHLASIGRMVSGISSLLEWDGSEWQQQAQDAAGGFTPEHLLAAERQIDRLSSEPYDRAYVLNQHPRALLAGALLAREMTGPRRHGPFDEELTPWASYVREVAKTRKGCRVHLADAFCGLCGIIPPEQFVQLHHDPVQVPVEFEAVGQRGGRWVGVIVGAGDVERWVPIVVWQQLIRRFLDRVPEGRIVLLGQERERGGQIQDLLPPSLLGRIWDATGRTTLPELAALLSRCDRVVGADTGPLHLAASVGAKVIGWYFARARVHETGPYGMEHLIWQAERTGRETMTDGSPLQPQQWPIDDTVASLAGDPVCGLEGWSVWTSQRDRWGAYYVEVGQGTKPPQERERLWRELQPALQAVDKGRQHRSRVA
jgi:heptosyltransferase I